MNDPRDAARARKVRWAVRLGRLLLAVLARTWRVEVRGAGPWRALAAAGRPYVFVLWHGDLLPLAWVHRGQGVAVLVSEHADGEIIARLLEGLGLRTVRGSTTRGGARALIQMTRELESGRAVAVTPDGPRGPRHTFQPGALVAAQRASVPVVPIGVHLSSAWRLGSWDRFAIPTPFARITVAYGAPTMVEGDDPRAAAIEVPRFAALLTQAGADAAR